MSRDVIAQAVAEARRRAALSERDLSEEVEHFEDTVREACEAWRLTAEGLFSGGVGSPCLAVVSGDGVPGVLKICPPGTADTAVRVMAAALGRGYARMLAWDPDRGALLTERLGADLWTTATTLDRQAEVIVPLLRQAWQVSWSCGTPFEGKAAGLLRILADLGPRYGSGHEEALALARSHATGLAATEQPEVVCHGDPHPGNVLRRGDGWALIDPDGFVGERAYDLGVVLRDGCRELAAAEEARPGGAALVLRAASHRLGGLAGVEPERVWRWGFVERVTTGLYLRWFGFPEESDSFLDTATLLATAGRPA